MKRISLYIGTALALLLTVFSSTAPAFAATTSSGLSITPRKNITLEPGKSVTDKLTVTNLNKTADLEVTFKVIDFTFLDNSGTPKLLLGDNLEQTAWSVKPFITIPKTLIVPAGQTRSVEYGVKIPEKQGAGSYYSAIQYGTGSSNGGNVSLSASGVSLMFVTVPGVVNEKLTLKQFGAYRQNTDGIGGKFLTIATEAPLEMGYSLQNDGNVAEAPVASMTLKAMIGGKKWDIQNANTNAALALRGQNRLFTACIEGETKQVVVAGNTTQAKVCKKVSLMPGRYTASLEVFYGQNGNNTHEVSGTTQFWYLPYWFIAAVAAVIILIIVIVVVITRKLRKATAGSRRR